MTDSPWLVYLLECADGTLYCGITNNVLRRLRQHRAGKGAKYTRGRGPFKMLCFSRAMTRRQAAIVECLIKKEPKARKLFTLRTWSNHTRRRS